MAFNRRFRGKINLNENKFLNMIRNNNVKVCAKKKNQHICGLLVYFVLLSNQRFFLLI